jgi:hypothetical protein
MCSVGISILLAPSRRLSIDGIAEFNRWPVRGHSVPSHSRLYLFQRPFEVHQYSDVAILARQLPIPVTKPTKTIRIIEDDLFALCHQPPHSLKCDAVCTPPFSDRNTLAAMQAPFGIDVVETHIRATDGLHQLLRNLSFSRERSVQEPRCQPTHAGTTSRSSFKTKPP